MLEQPLFFDNLNGEQLFGFHHKADNAKSVGVVFCHPFGEEKYRSYRAFVNFGRYLAVHNISSFRFDVKGAGDSDGELCESTIETQIEDTLDAISYFKNSSGVDTVVLIGLRLGASIAALTAERDDSITGLVLLSPISKGASYWRELLRTKQFASIALNQAATKSSELMQRLESTGEIEIEAQMLSLDFVNQLKAINLLEQTADFKGDLLVTGLARDSLGKDLSNKLVEQHQTNGHSSKLWCEEERDYWSILSLYDQYNPAATYQYTKNWLAEKGLVS